MQRNGMQHFGKCLPTRNTPLQGSEQIPLCYLVKARHGLMLHSANQRFAATVWGGRSNLTYLCHLARLRPSAWAGSGP